MHFKSCLLCSFVTFCVIFAAPTTLLITLTKLTHDKCPSYEILASKSLFLDRCIDSRPFVFDPESLDNAKIMLCSLYYSVFQHFCASTNSTFYNFNLTKEFVQIPEEFSNKPTEVCNSLKLINSTILKPDLVKVFNKSSSCVHLCTDVNDKVVDICSLTSFIWNLTVNYRPKDRSVESKEEILILSGKNKATNDATKLQNSDVNSQVKYGAGEQQNTSDHNLANQGSRGVVVQVPTSKITTVKGIITENDKEVPKPNKYISTTQQNDKVQGGESKSVLDGNQTITTVISNAVDNRMETPDTKNILIKEANNNGNQIKTNEINANHDQIKSHGTDLEDKTSRNTEVEGNVKTEGIKNIPIVSQPGVQKDVKKQDDNPEDTKLDDQTIYMDKDDDDDDENDPLLSKKITKVNEDKPEDNGDELPSPKSSEVKTKLEVAKPKEIDEDIAATYKNQNIDDSDSYFFSYFMMVCVVFICGYVAYHNKQKILALVLEGRKGRRPSRTRRPNSSNYRKLDSTLEEAVTSSCNKNSTQVIY